MTVKIINKAVSDGYDNDALYFVKKELKRDPKNLKVLKLQLYSKNNDLKNYNKLLISLIEGFLGDTDILSKHQELISERAKTLFIEKDYNNALIDFSSLSSTPNYQIEVMEELFFIYEIKKIL